MFIQLSILLLLLVVANVCLTLIGISVIIWISRCIYKLICFVWKKVKERG